MNEGYKTQPNFFTEKSYTYDQGIFLTRPNRFIAFVDFNGQKLRCHVPDPG
ncbi:hypothetical protein, partial [Streptococcus pseudopneumoniae]|uniref:hypothetical protein n=1 Tax=Streptococcus pseudopneumoniae TaxID=257758 RepID=UPI001BB29610